jgi:ASTRA-associated protein 1
MCYDESQSLETSRTTIGNPPSSTHNGHPLDDAPNLAPQADSAYRPVIITVSNAFDSGAIDSFHLPSERRISTLPVDNEIKIGMVMALSLSRRPSNGQSMVMSEYESGHAIVHVQQSNTIDRPWSWKKVLVRQPLLLLDVSLTADFLLMPSSPNSQFLPIPARQKYPEKPYKILNTKHAGQQGPSMRSDSKIFATTDWDARIRVYSAKMMRELTVLKWHKDDCYGRSFCGHWSGNGPRRKSRTGSTSTELAHDPPRTAPDAIKDQRNARAQNTH